jgi:hypothetical protein
MTPALEGGAGVSRGTDWFVPLSDIAPVTAPNYLIEELLVRGGTYFVVGGPKIGKSTLVTELSVALASGGAAFGRFPVAPGGRGLVMYLCVEGQLGVVRARADRIALVRSVPSDCIEQVRVSADRRFRLDDPWEMDRLEGAVETLRPAVLVLDPFGRLHRSDERSGLAMTSVLDRLFVLQQTYGFTVLVVHHVKKNSRASGSTLRGSSILWAAADGCLSLNPGELENEVELTIEHREAPSSPTIVLECVEPHDAPSYLTLKRIEEHRTRQDTSNDVAEQVLACLPGAHDAPMTRSEIRKACRVRNEHVGTALAKLRQAGRIEQVGRKGYRRRSFPVPALLGGNGNGAPMPLVEGLDV